MKRLALLLIFLIPLLSHSQTEKPEPKFPNVGNTYVTFNILTPFDPYTPRYRVGLIQSLNKSWSIGLDVGYGNEAITISNEGAGPGEDYRLYEIRSEIYHILNPTRRVNHYLSGEVFYINHSETFLDNSYETEQDEIIEYESVDYHRKKYGLHIKYGVFIPFGEHVGMNFYVGAGVRVRHNEFSNVVVSEGWDDNEYLFDIGPRKEGTQTAPNFALGIKFFCKL
ncbi:MAG: hypothetical protein COA40_12510 [Aequorivita sp.]|nr:MAG: hypothetical protein COA40_12510 [Aequorivita sp.]